MHAADVKAYLGVIASSCLLSPPTHALRHTRLPGKGVLDNSHCHDCVDEAIYARQNGYTETTVDVWNIIDGIEAVVRENVKS